MFDPRSCWCLLRGAALEREVCLQRAAVQCSRSQVDHRREDDSGVTIFGMRRTWNCWSKSMRVIRGMSPVAGRVGVVLPGEGYMESL